MEVIGLTKAIHLLIPKAKSPRKILQKKLLFPDNKQHQKSAR